MARQAHSDILRLAIMTPTIPERKKQFNALMNNVKSQIDKTRNIHPTLGKCIQLFLRSEIYDWGGPSIGHKRQLLIDEAKKSGAQFCCFLDDDETIAPNYVETLLRLIWEYEDKFNIIPDVCTFRSLVKLDNFWALVDMDMNNQGNQQITPDGITLRKPWHICPIQVDYASRFKFPDSNYGEDWAWFEGPLGFCKNQAHSEKIIHQYNHSMKTSKADNVTTAIE